MHIPRTLDQVTPTWLTAALREGGHMTTGEVTAAEAKTLEAGVGFVGQVARVHAEYGPGAGTLPSSYIIKLPSTSEEIRALMRPFRIFEREIRFYTEIAGRISLPVPRCWYSACDVANDAYVLLLEDLAPCRTGDQLAGCTLDEARMILPELARFHARWWDDPELQRYDWLFAVNDPVQRGAQAIYQGAWPAFLERFGQRLPAAMVEIGERYGRHLHAVQDRLAAMPNTIQHADFRLDNILFATEEGRPPFCVIDWQASTRGGGMMDVGYFLSQSLPVELRRAHERELLEIYREALLAAGVREYSSAQAFEEYRVGVLWGFIIPVFGTGNLDLSSDRAMALFTALVDRSVTAILDLDAGAVLPAD